MENYGFVYLWRDRKHNKYYIGSHWGNENDGYICSSNRMRNAYNKRPEDFKRRIIKRVLSNRKDLLDEEYYWLSQIKSSELNGVRYYNVSNHHQNHWSASENQHIRKTISEATKEAMAKPEIREKYLANFAKRDIRYLSDPIVRQKRSDTMKARGRNKGKITVKDNDGNVFHVTKDDPRYISGDVMHISKGIKRGPISDNHRTAIKESGVFKQLNSKLIQCVCGKSGNAGNIGRWHKNCRELLSCY